MKTSLVIMAAGMGSRFGGIKQLASVGPNGEILMEYSIRDAIAAGFDSVTFIIRHDLEKDFKEIIGNKIAEKIEVRYVFQEREDLPGDFKCPKERVKPWGTGQAILACKGVVKEPFAVINADDYYGRKAFTLLHDFLVNTNATEDGMINCGMAAFILGNTLSDNGTVTRGVCAVDDNNVLVDIFETKGIDKDTKISLDTTVSMNMWALRPSFIDLLEDEFVTFLSELNEENELKAEYLLPTVIDKFIKDKKVKVHSMKTDDKWYGMTYKEDIEIVAKAFRENEDL